MIDLPASPRVTLVIAMLNEAAAIGPCLASIAAQDYPPELLEVLVYDGGSTDGSVEIAGRIAAEHPGWAVRPNPRRIPGAAWNAGIQAATGDVVGIVSGHAELGSGYVASAVRALRETGADMVGGPVRAIGETPVGRAVAIAVSTPFGAGGARHRYELTERAVVDTVFMRICRRSTWLRFPFDESLVRNQEDEMSYRLLDAGGVIVCDPAIESRYRSRPTVRSLWHQYFDYGKWKVPVLRAHPRQVRLRHLAPLGLVATVAATGTLGLGWPAARLLAALEVLVYGAATVAAAVLYRDPEQPDSLLLLLLVYPTLHVSYGLGMAAGLVRPPGRSGTRPDLTP